MSIIDKIKKSVEDATCLPFYYDTPETLNARMGQIDLPCAMLDVVESGAAFDENGVIRERLTVQVLFVEKSFLDFDGIENERKCLDKMKKHAFRWLLALRQSEDLRLVSLGNTQRYYATQDAIVTAFSVLVTIEEIEGVCHGGQNQTNSRCHSCEGA